MRTTNHVVLVGNVGNDAKSGKTQSQAMWARVSIATSRKMKDGTYKTTWHQVKSWNKTAEMMAQFKKGDAVFIEGELEESVYRDKEGRDQKFIEVLAHSALRIDKAKISSQAAEDLGLDDSGEW